MKIGIDTFACNGGKSGVGVYLTQILKRIPPSGASFELFGWGFDRFAFSEAAPNMEFIPQCFINGRTANALWHIFSYPQFAKKRNYSACFFPAAHKQLPVSSPCPCIGTVHDIASYWGARETREHLGAVIRLSLPRAVRRLDRIIAVSNWVKQELIEFAGIKESYIEVIPDGIDTSVFFQRPRNDQSVVLIQPFSFRRPYILYVSRIDHPVKNHVKLIEAFAVFKERTRYPHRLVLAGSNNHGAEKVLQAAYSSKYRGDIFFTGHFPVKNLPELYAGADIVVIPSMYEGFGLGILEAMASGVPVACAHTASLPEAAGNAALYFDPRNVEEIAERMVTLTTNHDVYRECRRLGLERARLFSWDTCVQRTLEIIQEVADK
ncbi:MAG: glycosyltransferase family 4 protein [Treponema sp.]|jgi:glycosyltransferase involved in cell wall biosynthesis|nr:glycosyltransferase family 4 protein [Treponema sp.]